MMPYCREGDHGEVRRPGRVGVWPVTRSCGILSDRVSHRERAMDEKKRIDITPMSHV
jgi:hypothetical protein